MDLMIIPAILALLLVAFLIYRAYAMRLRRPPRRPDEEG